MKKFIVFLVICTGFFIGMTHNVANAAGVNESINGYSVILPTSQWKSLKWKYTYTRPEDGWQDVKFNDGKWKTSFGGFGNEKVMIGNKNACVGTTWETTDIWLRRSFVVKDALLEKKELTLYIFHDDDVEIYLNGKKIGEFRGFVGSYVLRDTLPGASSALKKGKNLIAVHALNRGGPGYIDVGLLVKKSQSNP